MNNDILVSEALAKREQLEADIRALLGAFFDETGLTPLGVDLKTVAFEAVGGAHHVAIESVRVRVLL